MMRPEDALDALERSAELLEFCGAGEEWEAECNEQARLLRFMRDELWASLVRSDLGISNALWVEMGLPVPYERAFLYVAVQPEQDEDFAP